AHNHQNDYEIKDPSDPEFPGVSDMEHQKKLQEVAKNIRDQMSKSQGNIPGSWAEWAEALLEPPVVDWKRQFRNIILRNYRKSNGTTHRTYSRLGRRCASLNFKAILPSRYGISPKGAIVQDTSGSMSDRDIAESLREAESIVKTICRKGG